MLVYKEFVMPRFFVDASLLGEGIEKGSLVCVDGENAHHISRSLRMKPGEELVLCDANGKDCHTVIESFEADRVFCRVERVEICPYEPPCKIKVYQAFCKGDKFDGIIQKCVELGMSEFTPVYSDNIISKPDAASAAKKLQRWQKIADEASKQCQRGVLCKINAPLSFSDALKEIKEAQRGFVCYENQRGITLKDVLPDIAPADCAFFIGPEGGLSEREVALVDEMGIDRVSLGYRILRTETAAPAVLAMFLYAWEL